MARQLGFRPAAFIALVLSLPGCGGSESVDGLPDSQETLAAAGRRLSRSLSVHELTELARSGDHVLGALTRSERHAVGQGYLRFRIDRPAVVTVAAPAAAVPFWLEDQGFEPTSSDFQAHGFRWSLFRKTFTPGWVGLGVNGLDRRPEAHYVVFVQSVDGERPSATELRGHDWRVVTADDGVSLAHDVSIPLQSVPGELRGATLLQPAHDRRHSTLLARGRVWKTHVASTAAADQVVVSFGEDAAHSLVWSWRTSPAVSGTIVRFARASKDGRGPADPTQVRLVEGESRLIAMPDLLNDPTVRRHRAAVADLEPGTAYVYSLGDRSPSAWSPWTLVRTAPENPDRYTMLYLGDAQNGFEKWGKLLKDAYEREPQTGMILLAGDLVDRGNERTNWDHFFLRAKGVFDRLPLMPCVGNHEYLDIGPRLYGSIFELPRNGPPTIKPNLVYHFQYADTFVAVLDSTLGVTNASMARLQAEWLDEALRQTRANWKFVMFHHPVYASHTSRESPGLRDAWVPVFDKHKVDLVLQGHDHAYLRTYPLRAGRRPEGSDPGTIYAVSVSGDKYYDQDPRGYTATGHTQLSTYQTIEVDTRERRLTYVARDAEGHEVDRFVIQKPQRPARVASRTEPPAAELRRR